MYHAICIRRMIELMVHRLKMSVIGREDSGDYGNLPAQRKGQNIRI